MLEQQFPKGHPATIDVARLRIVCPLHPDDVIATYVMTANHQVHVEPTHGWTEEFVSQDRISEETRERALDYLSPPVAHDPQSEAHHRYRFECTRPTCNYDAVLRGDGPYGMHALAEGMLSGMVKVGSKEAAITDVDKVWRAIR